MNEFLAGLSAGSLVSLSNACLLPLYPGLIAFLAGSVHDAKSSQRAKWLGIPVLMGVLTLIIALGLLIIAISSAFDGILTLLLPVIYAFVIIMGILLISGRNPFAKVQTLQSPIFKNPYLTAYTYGLMLGPMTLPCTGPAFIGAVAYSTSITDVVNGLIYFVGFGLGFGWILVVLPFLALPVQRRLVSWLANHKQILNVASGILLIAIGIFGILTELVPRQDPSFELTQMAQWAYWIVTLCLVAGVGYGLYRYQEQKISA
jgi:cytochrome c-type biogenesis protein